MTEEEIKYHNRLWYYKTYNQLIDKCIQMEKDGYPEDMYTEVHHILPKCQGGTNEKCNLVKMPVRYHIMAHILLAYAFPEEKILLYAAGCMISLGNKFTNEQRKLGLKSFSTKGRSGLNTPFTFRFSNVRYSMSEILSYENSLFLYGDVSVYSFPYM